MSRKPKLVSQALLTTIRLGEISSSDKHTSLLPKSGKLHKRSYKIHAPFGEATKFFQEEIRRKVFCIWKEKNVGVLVE